MTKKEYCITLLKALKNEWALAPGLLVLIEENLLDDKTINSITDIFRDAVKNMSDKTKKNKFNKSISYLDIIIEKEMNDKIDDEDILDIIKDL